MQLIPRLCNTVLVLMVLMVTEAVMRHFGFPVNEQILAGLFVALNIQGANNAGK